MEYSGITLSPGFIISAATDPQFNYVTALLHGDGASAGQNNTFLDSSPNNLTLTRNGTPTQGTFTPYGTLWSNYFNGSAGYLSIANNAVFDFGTGDCTFEAWVYNQAYANLQQIVYSQSLTSGANGYQFMVLSSGFLQMESQASGVDQAITATNNAIPLNTWAHVAFTRASGTNRLFVNGNLCTTTGTLSQAISTGGYPVYIGAYLYSSIANIYFNGYISNVRLVKGTAVYTSNFTPPTAPLTAITNTSLLTCQSNRFKDNSTNNFAITTSGSPLIQRFSPFGTTTQYDPATIGGSGLFGVADYFQLPTTSAFQFGTNDFTIECWVYLNSAVTAANRLIWYNYVSSFTTDSIFFGGHASYSGRITFWAYNVNASAPVLIDPTALTPYTWTHIAVVRSGTTFTLYRNGVSVNTATSSASVVGPTWTTGGYIGTSGSTSINGYLGNFRMVNGTAVYTSAFTPPTVPLASITNTAILLSCTNGQIYDNAMMNNLVTVGTAQVSTSVVKYGTGSMYFNGSSSYLTTLLSPNLQFSTGDFTIECWNYMVARTNSFPAIFSNYNSYTTGALSLFAGHGSGTITAYQVAINGAAFPVIQGGTIAYNTWVHLAVVRSSGTISLYVNGVSVGTPYSTAVTLNGVGSLFYIGTTGDAPATSSINGYIDEFRVTKGIARYTSNFLPPPSIFPSTGNIPVITPSVETLVVAGGGTGGIITNNRGTGGGAGGLIYITSFPVTPGTAYTVTVGAGGASSSGTVAVNGVNSSLSGASRTLTAIGGGSGGYGDSTNNGGIGGSGGGQWYPGYVGAASNQPVNTSDGITTYSTTGWGNAGGTSSSTQPYGSGGGGAGGAGGNWNGANGPVGGLGRSYDISGTTRTYAGGGSSAGYPAGGGTVVFDNTNYGGLGGGGTGYNNAYNTLANGAANTGGGGGSGGSGGSGVVILRFPSGYPPATSTTGSPTVTTTGGYNTYTWTSSGSITF